MPPSRVVVLSTWDGHGETTRVPCTPSRGWTTLCTHLVGRISASRIAKRNHLSPPCVRSIMIQCFDSFWQNRIFEFQFVFIFFPMVMFYRKVFYAQYDCKGPGAITNQRVSWVRELTTQEAQPFLSVHFINGKTWLKKFIGKKIKAKEPKNQP